MTVTVAQLRGSSSLRLELKNGPADASDAEDLTDFVSEMFPIHVRCEFSVTSTF